LRGFIFFGVFHPGHRFVFTFALLLLLVGGIFYPFYKHHHEERVIQAISWSVARKVIVVDPGHGGIDPGAVGRSGVLEKDINLGIAEKLKALLIQAGATVVMTREGDYDLSKPGSEGSRQAGDLDARAKIANDCGADLYISIHVNSFPSPRWWGAQVFYYSASPESKRLACLIQEELIKTLGDSGRWVKPEEFYLMKKVKMPAVIVEAGFISNPKEEILMKDPRYQSKVAWCIYAGVVRYFAGEEVREILPYK